MRAFWRILLFVAVGPAIGTLAMLLTTGIVSLARTGRPDDLLFLFSRWNDNAEILGFGYVMGGVPALVAGIVASILPRYMKTGWAYRGWVALGGAVASMIGIFVFVGPMTVARSQADYINLLSFLLMMAGIGAVAAFCCTFIYDGLRRVMTRTRVPA